ncbi:MAG: 7TM domain-containing protein [Phycisphaerales bacterium]|jgi:hypothetical protein
MQVDQRFVIITILILVLLSILGLTMRALYLESPSSGSIESEALSEEDNGVTENIESDPCPIFLVLDLTRIPTQTQTTLSFLLLVPVGLLITALGRGVVGIRTIGTFSPTLLALSQARSDWRIGVVIFIVTFGLGSLCRILLMRFRLSTVPRRGVIGTFVVSALVAAISVSHSYGLAPTARHILLPVAVMTVMIDRFFTVMETEGNRTALTILANSIAIAVCCFAVFAYTRMGQLLLRFPELELLIMAILIVVGRYSGRSLLDALGFQGNGSFEQKGTE